MSDLQKQYEAATGAPSEFLGSEGRGVSLYKQASGRKKWNATPSDDNRRPDDFVGASPSKARRSWRPKSHSEPETPKSEASDHHVVKIVSPKTTTESSGLPTFSHLEKDSTHNESHSPARNDDVQNTPEMNSKKELESNVTSTESSQADDSQKYKEIVIQ